MTAGSTLHIPNEYQERALYILEGECELEDETMQPLTLTLQEADEHPH